MSLSSSFSNTNSSAVTYTCGTCKSSLPSVMLLHQHLLNHGPSYHYNDVIKLAFTKYETTCKSTQTNSDSFPETHFENVVKESLLQNAEQLIEEAQSDGNDKVYTELSGSPDLLKRPSNSNIFDVASIAGKVAVYDDSVSDVSDNESDSNDTYKEVKNVTESVECSTAQNVNDDTRIMLKIPGSINHVRNIHGKSLLRNDKCHVDDSKYVTLKHKQALRNRTNCSVEITHGEDVVGTAHQGDTVETKTQEGSSKHDTEKQTDLFNGKISLNNYHVKRDRPKGVFYFGERDEFMRVKVCKTWVPHTCGLTAEGDNRNDVVKLGCEQMSVQGQNYTNFECLDDMSKKSKGNSGNWYSTSVSDEGIVDSSRNLNTLNDELTMFEENLDEVNDDGGCVSVSDGIPIEAPQQFYKLSPKHRFPCSKCGKSYRYKLSLEYHMNNHLGRKPYLCQGCGRTFSSKKTLDIHWLHHHVEKQFECNVCHMKLPSAARLREHTSTHAGMKDYTYTCSVCNKKYKSARYLRQHVQYAHKLNKKECKVCCKVFSSLKEYSKHKTRCSRTPIVCDVCNKTFSSYGSLRRHGAIHANHRPHQCHVCYRRFLQKGPYWIHMVKHHDLTKDDLIRLFPDKHADRHFPHDAEKVNILPEFENE